MHVVVVVLDEIIHNCIVDILEAGVSFVCEVRVKVGRVSAHLGLSLLVALETLISASATLILTLHREALEQLSKRHCKELCQGKIPTTPYGRLTRATFSSGKSFLRAPHSKKHGSAGPSVAATVLRGN